MVTDLQIKVEKYETKAAKCEESARLAPDEPERSFYQELANYYGAVATDFRQVIEKRPAPNDPGLLAAKGGAVGGGCALMHTLSRFPAAMVSWRG